MPLPSPVVTRVDLFEGAATYVLIGHEGPSRRRLMHIQRPTAGRAALKPGMDACPPVTEDRRTYTEEECMARLAEIGAQYDAPLVCVLKGSALLGMVRFLEGWYMLFVTRHEVAGVIGGHFIHRVEETAMHAVLPAAADAMPPPAPSSVASSSAASVAASAPASRAAEANEARRLQATGRASSALPAVRPTEALLRENAHLTEYERNELRASTSGAAVPGSAALGGVDVGGDDARSTSLANHWDPVGPAPVDRAAGPAPIMLALGGGKSSQSLVRGGKLLLAAAFSKVATSLQLTGLAENWAETKYKNLFSSMDLTRDFYFSYTYDLTSTLQENMRSKPGPPAAVSAAAAAGAAAAASAAAASANGAVAAERAAGSAADAADDESGPPPRDKFIWNHHLAYGLLRQLSTSVWVPPVVHGFFMQV